MANIYSQKGYLTMADLDSLVSRIETLENQIQESFANYKNGAATKSASSLKMDEVGFDVIRIKIAAADLTSNYRVKFSQPFVEAPVVVASADTHTKDYVAFVDAVDNQSCVIRFVKINDNKVTTGSKNHYVNIIAVGKTKA